jgi:hypothetical protein
MTHPPSTHIVLAERLAGLFARLPVVEAVALGGSQVGGTIDPSSDIDLYVFTHSDLPLADRQVLLQQSGGASQSNLGLTYWGPGDEWFDAASGIEVDIVYFDQRWMLEQIERVMLHHQASLGYTTCFAKTIRDSHIFHDPQDWLVRLQRICQQPFPEALRRNIVSLNHPVLRSIIPAYAHQIEKAVQRNDHVSINHRLAALLASYFDIIFAVNQVLHPGEKRMLDYALAHCAKLPVDFEENITTVLKSAVSSNPVLVAQINFLLDHLDQLLSAEGLLPINQDLKKS